MILSNDLRTETQSTHLHNMVAEGVMGSLKQRKKKHPIQ